MKSRKGNVVISKLRYFHGTGYDFEECYPVELSIAVSVGRESITDGIRKSIEVEDVLTLAGEFGDPSAGDPIEVDRLEIALDSGQSHTITVFNRGLALLFGDNDEVRRLHRCFGVIEKELNER